MVFEHIKCDGCGREFENGDDVVVCPVCGTPQHRSCYELGGGCVNSAKHQSGFEWHKEPASQNDKKAETTDFQQEQADIKPRGGIFGNTDPGIGDSIDIGNEVPELDDLIESRVKVLAPGITYEQRREQLCGAEIGKTISFIGSNAVGYVKKFRKMEHQKKHTFNWAAFFFAPVWYFYRKLYKQGAVFLSLFVSITMLMAEPAEKFLSLYNGLIQNGIQNITEADYQSLVSAVVPVFAFEAITLVIRLIAGFTADKSYWKYCKKSLERVEATRETHDEMAALSYYLSHCSTSFLFALLSMIVYSFLPQILISLF